MKSTRPAHGIRSARLWQDIRQAARLARSEGVIVKLCRDGSTVISPAHPLQDSPAAAGIRRSAPEKAKEATRDSTKQQPMEPDGCEPVKLSKKQQQKQQRDASRRQDFLAKKAKAEMPPPPLAEVEAQWLLFNWQVRKAALYAAVREHRERFQVQQEADISSNLCSGLCPRATSLSIVHQHCRISP